MCSSNHKKTAKKSMFPNYCFKKQADDFGYEILYVPKKNYSPSMRQSSRLINDSNARTRSRPPAYSKLCYEDLLTLQSLREQNERDGHKTQSSTVPLRNVKFCLPSMEKQRQFALRQSGGSPLTMREIFIKQLQEQETETPTTASEPARDIQESCADFFNIIYENVLEAVNEAVEHNVDKHFANLLSRVNQLNSEMSAQENMLKQLNADMTNKINEINDVSLNQFKFIAQMLIDSQTIHYKAMNQQRLLKQQRKDERERLADGYNVANVKSTQQRQQHQLWQQQDTNPLDYMQMPCTNCNRRTVLRRSRKETSSMPNLHQASISSSSTTNSSGSQAKHQHDQEWSQFGTRRVVNTTPPSASSTLSKCRCRYQCRERTI